MAMVARIWFWRVWIWRNCAVPSGDRSFRALEERSAGIGAGASAGCPGQRAYQYGEGNFSGGRRSSFAAGAGRRERGAELESDESSAPRITDEYGGCDLGRAYAGVAYHSGGRRKRKGSHFGSQLSHCV